jgi:two-component system sensor histidine kinase RegB
LKADPAVDPRSELRALSLVRLRWGAVAGEAFSLLVARYTFGADLPLAVVLALVGLMAASNLLLASVVRRRAIPAAWIAAVLAFDTVQLTAVLAAVGGSSNPFSILYLVQITMAALMLGPRWTWALAGLAATAYAALFVLVPPSPVLHDHTGEHFASHLRSMWMAFSVAAGLIAYFVVRLAAELERREQELVAERERASRHERLAALTTLAAGAAHELGTPLATVAVVARELEVAVCRLPGPVQESMGEDVRLIRSELDRCRLILDRMAARSGETAGEQPEPVTGEGFAREVVSNLSEDEAARVDVRLQEGVSVFVAPPRALAASVLNLVRNGLDASAPAGRVTMEIGAAVSGDHARILITVSDRGPGMPPDVLSRACEPFFTTKAPGQGLGLGLFLARTLVEHLGGRFTLDSTPGTGTRASVELPAAAGAAAVSAHA